VACGHCVVVATQARTVVCRDRHDRQTRWGSVWAGLAAGLEDAFPIEHCVEDLAGALGHAESVGARPCADLVASELAPPFDEVQVVGDEGGDERGDVPTLGERRVVIGHVRAEQPLDRIVEQLARTTGRVLEAPVEGGLVCLIGEQQSYR
jgi:hypothetical protein